eukprot:Nitzschia sp. Nitz4//scaffold205_size38804//13404//16468//NITZ4_007642-RA/size38804-augustus-gene-0.50-mRNA-1//1//CDS//3329541507//4719//frame0
MFEDGVGRRPSKWLLTWLVFWIAGVKLSSSFPLTHLSVASTRLWSSLPEEANEAAELPDVPYTLSVMDVRDNPYVDPSLSTVTIGNVDNEWDVYKYTMETVIEKARLRRPEANVDLKAIQAYLLSPIVHQPQSRPPLFVFENKDDFQSHNLRQKELFLQNHKFSDVEWDYAQRMLSYVANVCAKQEMARPLIIVWQKIKEIGMTPPEKGYTTYIYALDRGRDKAKDPNEYMATMDVLTEVAVYHDLHYEPIEQTIALRPTNETSPVLAPRDISGSDWKTQLTNLEVVDHFRGIGFGDEPWNQYVDMMTDIIENTNPRRREKTMDRDHIVNLLLSPKCHSFQPPPTPEVMKDKDAFVQYRRVQKRRYMEHYNLTYPQYEYASRILTALGSRCAKVEKSLPLLVAWQKLNEGGMSPLVGLYGTFMYSLGLMGDEGLGKQNVSDSWVKRSGEYLVDVATQHDLRFNPSERTVSLRMKGLIAKGEIAAAEELLDTLVDSATHKKEVLDLKHDLKKLKIDIKRLRTYLPLLEHYCEIGDVPSLLRLLNGMKNAEGVHVDLKSYAMVLGALAKCGRFQPGATPLQGTKGLDIAADHGPKLLDDVMSRIATDFLEIPEELAQQLQRDFVAGAGSTQSADMGGAETPTLASRDAAGNVMGRVYVDNDTGICRQTGAQLRLLTLDDERREYVHDRLLEMARLSYNEVSLSKKRKQADADYGYTQLEKFSKWLDTRSGEPFTAIIDGANVGYHGGADIQYAQIESMFNSLKEMGENPLVIMPYRYTIPLFKLPSRNMVVQLTDQDMGLVRSLRKSGHLYVAPKMCHDDYYLILASVSNQTNARGENSIHVPVDNSDGRCPGLRPIVVTNDQMRDHRLKLLGQREYRRWLSCHVVTYDIERTQGDPWGAKPAVELHPADFFSREIQQNPTTSEGVTAWHIPVTEWEEPSRYCLSIKC